MAALIEARDGRVFEFVRTSQYTRAGRVIKLAHWQGACAVCGAPFEVRTPLNFDPVNTKALDQKHCNEHKLTRSQVHQRWLAGRNKRNRARSGGLQ